MSNIFKLGLGISLFATGCSDGGGPIRGESTPVWIDTDEGVGYNVLDAIPDGLEAGILDRTGTVDLSSYIQTAIDQLCAGQLSTSDEAILAFPAGSYLVEHTLRGCDALTLTGAKFRGRRGAALVAGPNFDSPVGWGSGGEGGSGGGESGAEECTPAHQYDRRCLRAPILDLMEQTDPPVALSHVSVTGLVFDLGEQDVDGIRIYGGFTHRIERCAFSRINAGQAAVRGGAAIDLTIRDNRFIGQGFSLDLRSLNAPNGTYGVNVALIEENYFQAGGGVRFGGIGINFTNNWLESSLDPDSRAWVEACDNNAPGSSALHEYRHSLSNNYFEVSLGWEAMSPPDPLPAGSAIRACNGATVTDNFIAGPGPTANAYVGLSMPLTNSVITGNLIRDWPNCANVVGGNDDAAGVFLANTLHNCPTFAIGGEDNLGLIQTPEGGYSLSGASTSVGVVSVSLTGNSIDAAAGSLQELITSVPREVTLIENKQIGQQLCLLSPNDLVTLDATAFNRLYDYQLVPGETACFIVDDDLQLRSINLPHETLAALTELPDLDWWLGNDVSQLQLSGTNVERWLTQAGGSTHDVLQTTVAKQPQWLSAGVDMQGTRYLVGNGVASDWSFLHNAGTLFVVFRPKTISTTPREDEGYFLATADGNAAIGKMGVSLYFDDDTSTPRVRVRVYNGTSSYATNFNTQNGFVKDATYVFGLILSASGTARAYRDYLEVGSSTLGSMTTSAPTVPVRVGDKGHASNNFPFRGSIHEVVHYASELNDRQRSAVVELLRAKHDL
ncbi:MAG TPA: hypothetical protein VJN18_09755 [Polyangiaceae bacterium]|nr:hypothetical protein [Polyangiaceae bacterium]